MGSRAPISAVGPRRPGSAEVGGGPWLWPSRSGSLYKLCGLEDRWVPERFRMLRRRRRAMADKTTRAVMDEYLQALLHGSDFGRFFAPDVVWTTMETGEEVRGRD